MCAQILSWSTGESDGRLDEIEVRARGGTLAIVQQREAAALSYPRGEARIERSVTVIVAGFGNDAALGDHPMQSGSWSKLSAPAERRGWTIESSVRAAAGTMILASVGLAVLVDRPWLRMMVFVGVNFLPSANTGWRRMSNLLALASGRAKR